jgi:DNA-directed RNA polymerase specialized sigma24 family protein
MEKRGEAGAENISSHSLVSEPPRRKWALTQQAFDRLLASLNENRDRAGEKYQEVRSNLIRFFEWRGGPYPEDHADETLNRVARRIEEGQEIRDPSSYAFGVARMLLLEILKGQERERLALNELSSSYAAVDDPAESEPRLECLKQCLPSLSLDNRELIMQYYQGEKGVKIENRKKLSERLQVPLNTLRMRALRLREKLEACVENCLKK